MAFRPASWPILFLSEADPLSDQGLSLLLRGILWRAGLSLVLLWLMKQWFDLGSGRGRRQTGRGVFRYGSVVLFFGVIPNLVMSYSEPELTLPEALPSLCLTCAAMTAAAVLEEILFRGLLFNLLRRHFGSSHGKIILSVLVSSALFGLAHLLNLFSSSVSAWGTAIQVVYAASMGVLMAVIYFRAESLLPCVILHGMLDFSASFWPCFSASHPPGDIPPASVFSAGQLLFFLSACAACLISGMLQLKKALQEPPKTRSC